MWLLAAIVGGGLIAIAWPDRRVREGRWVAGGATAFFAALLAVTAYSEAPPGEPTPQRTITVFVILGLLVVAGASTALLDDFRPWTARSGSVDHHRWGCVGLAAVAISFAWIVASGPADSIAPLPGADYIDQAVFLGENDDLQAVRVETDVRLDPASDRTVRVNYLADDARPCDRLARVEVAETDLAITVTVIVAEASDDTCDSSNEISGTVHRYAVVELDEPIANRALHVGT